METQGGKRARRTHVPLTVAVAIEILVAGPACRKDSPGPASSALAAPAALAAPPVDLVSLSSRVGVKLGSLTYSRVGPAASLMKSPGPVNVRRVGEERFNDSTPNMPLYAGDQLWTGPHMQATVALADNTLIQMGEETCIAIGNRAVAADPASSAAVLYGVARLSISPRTRGEGAFLTTAGSTLIGAKGTVFVVAVAAGGRVRVGVEHGEAEVAGGGALDKPVTLQTAQVIVVEPSGVPGKAEAFARDDWGAWRYEAEAHETVEAAARLHGDHLVGTEGRLDSSYLLLQTLGTTASTLTWQAEGTTKPKGLAEYKATALERGASIEAMYRLSVEIARLTNAALSDAFILTELYRRHPKEVAPQFMEFGQEVCGAILYNKKLQVISEVFLAPLRPAYYAHTARGRARAASLDMPAPSAFPQVKLPEIAPAEIARRLPTGLYAPPRLDSTSHGHPLWQRAPKAGWDERLTLQPVPPRQGSWYIAPTQIQAHLLAGVAPNGPLPTTLAPFPATEPAKAELGFLIPPLPPIGPDASTGP